MRRFIISFVAFWLGLVSALPYRGADFFSLLLLESTTHVEYTSSSTTACQPFENILQEYGVNLARIRVWTTGTYSLSYGLELAKRARAAGMDLLIDLHYDDTWADGGHQAIPSGWPTDLRKLASKVYHYTRDVVYAFNAQGTPIRFIQIGNEINDGLLWPKGRISVNGFTGASQLLHAGARAVHAASPSTKTVIHLANGWNQSDISFFYNGIFRVDGGLTRSDVDVMAFSFYPFYGTNATLLKLGHSLDYVVSAYDMDVLIVETDWPAACNATEIPLSEPTITAGVNGQIEWTQGISRVLDNVNSKYCNKALGIVYWEPGWIGNAALGSNCSDNLLVTNDGVVRESLKLFSGI